MDDPEFDRLVARASDPRLIAGISNYCDRRCHRCRFTDRCLTFIEDQENAGADEAPGEPASVATTVRRALDRTLGMIQVIAGREGIDLSSLPDDGECERVTAQLNDDPLVAMAQEYGVTTWRIARVLEPIVAAKGDRALIEAVDTLLWLCTLVPAKVFRAVTGAMYAGDDPNDLQSDPNGSAKVARLHIDESRRAWKTLMQAGKATANGVPAKLVGVLDDLDASLAERFPHAMAFIRPGFDE